MDKIVFKCLHVACAIDERNRAVQNRKVILEIKNIIYQTCLSGNVLEKADSMVMQSD